MAFLQSLAFILGRWDKKAHESIQKIELLSSSLHARLLSRVMIGCHLFFKF